MTDEVKFTDEQWDKVAQAAEVFARALEAEQIRLHGVAERNWAGNCTEGEGVIENLRQLINRGDGSFAAAIGSEASYLRSVASGCREAKSDLIQTDDGNSEKIPN